MASGSPLYSFSIVSLASPYSGLDAEISMPSVRDGKFHGVRARVGKLRDALHGVVQFSALDHHFSIVVARQDGFVIRELSGEHARNQQAFSGAEEKMAFVEREFDFGVFARFARQALHFRQRLLGDERTHFPGQTLKFVIDLGYGQAVAVGGHHGDRLRLQQQAARRSACSAILRSKSRRRSWRSATTRFSREFLRADAETLGSPENYPWPFRPFCRSCGRRESAPNDFPAA